MVSWLLYLSYKVAAVNSSRPVSLGTGSRSRAHELWKRKQRLHLPCPPLSLELAPQIDRRVARVAVSCKVCIMVVASARSGRAIVDSEIDTTAQTMET